jgi:hypothetical protein
MASTEVMTSFFGSGLTCGTPGLGMRRLSLGSCSGCFARIRTPISPHWSITSALIARSSWSVVHCCPSTLWTAASGGSPWNQTHSLRRLPLASSSASCFWKYLSRSASNRSHLSVTICARLAIPPGPTPMPRGCRPPGRQAPLPSRPASGRPPPPCCGAPCTGRGRGVT